MWWIYRTLEKCSFGWNTLGRKIHWIQFACFYLSLLFLPHLLFLSHLPSPFCLLFPPLPVNSNLPSLSSLPSPSCLLILSPLPVTSSLPLPVSSSLPSFLPPLFYPCAQHISNKSPFNNQSLQEYGEIYDKPNIPTDKRPQLSSLTKVSGGEPSLLGVVLILARPQQLITRSQSLRNTILSHHFCYNNFIDQKYAL